MRTSTFCLTHNCKIDPSGVGVTVNPSDCEISVRFRVLFPVRYCFYSVTVVPGLPVVLTG
jgi:hypothetical protein